MVLHTKQGSLAAWILCMLQVMQDADQHECASAGHDSNTQPAGLPASGCIGHLPCTSHMPPPQVHPLTGRICYSLPT